MRKLLICFLVIVSIHTLAEDVQKPPLLLSEMTMNCPDTATLNSIVSWFTSAIGEPYVWSYSARDDCGRSVRYIAEKIITKSDPRYVIKQFLSPETSWEDRGNYFVADIEYYQYQEVLKNLSEIYGEPEIIQPIADSEQDYIWKYNDSGYIHLWVSDTHSKESYIAIHND